MGLYDPYNYPAVTLYEWDGCEGESGSLGVRNFTYSDGMVSEYKYSTWNLTYPAKDANSFVVPYNSKIEMYESGKFVDTLECTSPEGCGCQCMKNDNNKCVTDYFDTVHAYFLDLEGNSEAA